MAAQMQRRVFWACYINDRHSSAMLGRPMAIQDAQITIDVSDEGQSATLCRAEANFCSKRFSHQWTQMMT